jgi:hypothetical protein
MATLPQLSSTIHSQNKQLQSTIEDNTDFCRVISETISTLQHQQSNTDFRIDNIQALLNKLIHKSTPTSSGRNCKKSKPADSTQVNLFAKASDGDYDDHLPTLQLEMLLNNNTSAISNALNTTNESINMSFNLPQQDNLLDNRQTPLIDEQDNNNRDLGNPYPATET